MSKVTWIDDAPVLGLGAVAPESWFDSGCGAGPRARWLPDGTIEVEGEGVPVRALPKDVAQWSAQIASSAKKHGVPPQLVAGIMSAESGGQPKVHSFCCYGLMGLLPATANTQAGRTVAVSELVDDPALNIDLGTKLLGSLFKKYGGNVVRIAAAYNAGSPKCGAGKCGAPNRWNLVADCVSGKAVDYSGRVVGYLNGAVKAGVGAGPGAVSSAKGTSLWQVLVGAAVVLPVGAIALGLWRPAAVTGMFKANPVDESLIKRAASILQYAPPREAAEILEESEGVSAEDARLAVRAGTLLLRDREEGTK